MVRTVTGIRLKKEVITKLDHQAEKIGTDRSTLMRKILLNALNQLENNQNNITPTKTEGTH